MVNRMTKILIVEDDERLGPQINECLKVLLVKFPVATIVVVRSWADGAVEMDKVPAPDAVILDLGLPDSEWTRTLDRVDVFESRSPVVIVSGYPAEAVQERLRRPEIEVLQKRPGFFDQLIAALFRAFQRASRGNMESVRENIHVMRELVPNAPTQ